MISDEDIVKSWQEAGRELAEKQAEQARQAQADHDAKVAAAKTKRDHQDKLAREKAKLEEQIEETEKWEKRSETLEGQLSALMKRQKGG
jgi:hypothetical protein